ncbi:MAG: hypothetical protein RR475_08855 [Clostridia bacterium]
MYLYLSKDADFCSYDEWYETIADALDSWENIIDTHRWTIIDLSLLDCQQDAIKPIRIKGYNVGKLQFGKYEILHEDKWIDYIPCAE